MNDSSLAKLPILSAMARWVIPGVGYPGKSGTRPPSGFGMQIRPIASACCKELVNNLKRILLVEDDPKDVELALNGLADYNLANEVVVARDGEEALDYLYRRGSYQMRPNGNPAVMLLDLKLPKVDGFEVVQQVRADEKLKMIPVVVLTSSHEEKDLVRSYKLGANGYVVKPVDFHRFVNAVKELGVFWAVLNEPPPGSVRKP
jgi:CheY-like chemotaxis protein